MLGAHARGGALRRFLSRCLNTRSIDGLGATPGKEASHREPPFSSRCLNTKSTGVLGAHARGGGGPEGTPTLPRGV